jgi:peptide/nickel transport system substrate-binding protein
MTALVFNTRRPVFADQRVRRALIHLFDFEWINRNLYHGLYSRTHSFFERSMLSSSRQPADAYERELLAPFMDEIEPEVLSGEFRLPVSEGNGRNRDNWRIALELLTEAGYSLEGGRLISKATGEQLTFEMLAATSGHQRLFLSFARDLERLGIKPSIRLVDSAQYQSRLNTYDYDMIWMRWPSSLSPGNEQLFRWSSQLADRDGTFNFAGVKSPAVDAMIAAMLSAEDADQFVSSVHALDRALLSGDYVIPLYHLQKQWVAYWRHLGQPAKTSLFGYQVDTWWSATIEKAEAVERTRN